MSARVGHLALAAGDGSLLGLRCHLQVSSVVAVKENERVLGKAQIIDLREDPTALQRLKDAAERAKCELSFTDRVTVMVPRITSSSNLEYPLSRAQLEKLCADMVDRTIEVTREAVAMAGLQLRQIDDIVLVGGQRFSQTMVTRPQTMCACSSEIEI